MSETGLKRASALLREFRDIFRIKLGPDPPAKVEPLCITLNENARPVRCTQRRYGPAQRAFIASTIKILEDVKAVYVNAKARWAGPALVVLKPGTEKFRFTVCLRAPNRERMPIASAIPDLESM